MSTTLQDPPKTGLALPAATVALTTSRALTSHLRRRYHAKYHGRYRFARSVFAFDLALLILALGLLVFNIALFTRPLVPRSIGLDLSLRTSPLVAGTIIPVEATLRSTDGAVHEDVELFWHLPAEAEIIRAEPPLTKDKSVILGRLAPGEDRVSRLYVRIRALPQAAVPFSFSIHEGYGRSEQIVTGSEERTVMKSALTASVAIPADAIVAGGSVPILVKNESDLMAPAVIIRLLTKDGAPASRFAEGDDVRLGDLKPQEQRVIFLDVDPAAQGRVEFVWEVQDASRPLSVHALNVDIVDDVAVSLTEPLRSTPGAEATDIDYQSSGPAMLWVSHPLQTTVNNVPYRLYDLAAGAGRVHIPLVADLRTPVTNWSVIPYETQEGKIVIGKRTVGTLSTAFPFSAAVRYYAVTGDQLGIGPLPPRVGEITSYWVVWTIGPTDADLKNLNLTTTLAPGVLATGKFAAQTPGEFVTEGSTVNWTIPSLPVTGDTPATFAFEIRYRPSAADRGDIPNLVLKSSASAIEVRSDLELRAVAPEQDTNLQADLQARGKGTVE